MIVTIAVIARRWQTTQTLLRNSRIPRLNKSASEISPRSFSNVLNGALNIDKTPRRANDACSGVFRFYIIEFSYRILDF